jgi:hypothetical protein
MIMKNLFIIILVLFSATSLLAQDTVVTKKENKNKSLLGYFIVKGSKPVTESYANGILIDNQTNVTPQAKTLEFVIQHRFGSIENGLSDFLGIYGAANTRLALNYSITNWAQIGFGTTKTYKLQDFSLKINVLKQSRDNKSPVDVTYYGNFSLDARDKEKFGESYKFGNRAAYFNELMVTRKFCDWFTMTVGGSFTHFNQVDSLYDHDKIALHLLGRVKFSPQSAVIINYDLPLEIEGLKEWYEPTWPMKYNFGIGYEVATATHTFQVFVGSANNLVPQYNIMKNENEFFKSTQNIFIGFNITRMWNF